MTLPTLIANPSGISQRAVSAIAPTDNHFGNDKFPYFDRLKIFTRH